MKFSPVKYILNVLVLIAALAVIVLCLTGTIAEFWAFPAIIAVVFCLTLCWYLTIPFGKAKEAAAAERVKAQQEQD